MKTKNVLLAFLLTMPFLSFGQELTGQMTWGKEPVAKGWVTIEFEENGEKKTYGAETDQAGNFKFRIEKIAGKQASIGVSASVRKGRTLNSSNFSFKATIPSENCKVDINAKNMKYVTNCPEGTL